MTDLATAASSTATLYRCNRYGCTDVHRTEFAKAGHLVEKHGVSADTARSEARKLKVDPTQPPPASRPPDATPGPAKGVEATLPAGRYDIDVKTGAAARVVYSCNLCDYTTTVSGALGGHKKGHTVGRLRHGQGGPPVVTDAAAPPVSSSPAPVTPLTPGDRDLVGRFLTHLQEDIAIGQALRHALLIALTVKGETP